MPFAMLTAQQRYHGRTTDINRDYISAHIANTSNIHVRPHGHLPPPPHATNAQERAVQRPAQHAQLAQSTTHTAMPMPITAATNGNGTAALNALNFVNITQPPVAVQDVVATRLTTTQGPNKKPLPKRTAPLTDPKQRKLTDIFSSARRSPPNTDEGQATQQHNQHTHIATPNTTEDVLNTTEDAARPAHVDHGTVVRRQPTINQQQPTTRQAKRLKQNTIPAIVSGQMQNATGSNATSDSHLANACETSPNTTETACADNPDNPADAANEASPEPERGTNSTRIVTFNIQHLTFNKQDELKTLLNVTQPDILILTEIATCTKQNKSNWLKNTLQGYTFWTSTPRANDQPNTTKTLGTLIAIRSHIPVTSNVDIVQHPHALHWTMLTIHIQPPHSNKPLQSYHRRIHPPPRQLH